MMKKLIMTLGVSALAAAPIAAQTNVRMTSAAADSSSRNNPHAVRASADMKDESKLAALGAGAILAVLAGAAGLYIVIDAINDEIDRPVSP